MQQFFHRRVRPLLQLTQRTSVSSQQLLEAEREKTRAAFELLERERRDFITYKKRTEQRLATARIAGLREACTKLIPSVENMQRMQDLPACIEEDDPWLEGFLMAHRELAKTLRAFGLIRFGRVGQKFDPYRHHAIGVEYRPGEESVIVAILHSGYLFRTNDDPTTDQLLQPAQVIVSSNDKTLTERR